MGRKMYYYTDYNTFKLILLNGTLRFKQSTASNDHMDTVHIYDILKNIARKALENEKISEPLKFIYEYYDHTKYGSNKICVVSCFTRKKDSRLLWDAYTMNRKDRKAERYNGVCIEFYEDEIRKVVRSQDGIFDYVDLQPIMYGDSNIYTFLNDILKTYLKDYHELMKDKDQHQDIVPTIRIPLATRVIEIDLKKSIVYPAITLTNNIENVAPLFKHQFWKEEEEIRAIFSVKSAKISDTPMQCDGDNNYFFDLPINEECISKIILGPELAVEELQELESLKGKIDFTVLEKEESEGTGVIRSSN